MATNESADEIGQRLNRSRNAIYQAQYRLRELFGVADNMALADRVRQYLVEPAIV